MDLANATMPYNCAPLANMPWGGTEILLVSAVFMFIITMYTVTFIDVAVKQLWPQKYLDPVVVNRVKQIQAAFPHLGKPDQTEEEAAAWKLANPDDTFYNKVLSQSAYAAGRAVDEDMICILCNKSAFDTVSSYCASTVRGYMSLSTFLITGGTALSFMWLHNIVLWAPLASGAYAVTLAGYILLFLTGFIMTGANSDAVYRNRNIALWSNVPYSMNDVMNCHPLGVGCFIVLPWLSHLYLLVFEGGKVPNYTQMHDGWWMQLAGALCFGAPYLLGDLHWVTKTQQKQYTILGEIICVLATFIVYVQQETFPTATCVNKQSEFQNIMYGAILGPFAIWVLRHYNLAPTSLPTEPSLLLMSNGQPAATAGPPTAMVFSQNPAKLPRIPYPTEAEEEKVAAQFGNNQ